MNTYWILRDGFVECQVDTTALTAASSAAGAGGTKGNNGKPISRYGLEPPRSNFATKLTRRGRVLVSSLALALTVPLLSAGTVAAIAEPVPENLAAYTVVAGESLWTIAEKYKEPGTDTRDEIYRLKKLNHLTTSDIFAGQVIYVVPAS